MCSFKCHLLSIPNDLPLALIRLECQRLFDLFSCIHERGTVPENCRESVALDPDRNETVGVTYPSLLSGDSRAASGIPARLRWSRLNLYTASGAGTTPYVQTIPNFSIPGFLRHRAPGPDDPTPALSKDGGELLSQRFFRSQARWLNWLEREFIDRNVRGSDLYLLTSPV
ncbi:hypothetical protein T265_01027 [Opisthorchis viverrini]|uniref:Uncharacterized protein n=1 Tax=Opisthorchis viverrini TaxID=6198 RepID=A0A074ZZP3_OPIVI|nr:hypothetical protein T265_01027 [Opisthorchis viverrini]KER32933.1 hypothetical protein T265_01027 [Opisthorchis viverrini]